MTKLMTELKETLATLKRSVGTVEDLVSDMESKEKKEEEWPKIGCTYFFVNSRGHIHKEKWMYSHTDKDRKAVGNCYRTEAEVELHRLRLESMAQRGPLPKKWESIWCWSFKYEKPDYIEFSPLYLSDWWIGAVKKTEEECEAWHKIFGKAWEVTFE